MKAHRGERLKNPKLRKFATEMRVLLLKEANKRLIGSYLKRDGMLTDNEYSINQDRIKELQALILKLHGERRIIRLKNPKLIKIRTGFRTLLEYEWSKRMDEIDNQGHELYRKYLHNKSVDEATFDTQNQEIQAQQAASKDLRKASISSCALCGDMEKDHVHEPQTRNWYCEECLQLLDKKNYFEELYNWDFFSVNY